MARDEIEREFAKWCRSTGPIDERAAFVAGFLACRKRAVEECNRLREQADESWRELDDEATYFRAAGMGECAAALEKLGEEPR